MSITRIFLTVLSAATLLVHGARAITADELARYFGVSWWTTKIDLPPEAFTAEIFHIVDGAVGERLIEGMPAWSKKPESGLSVLLGVQDGKYKLVVAYGGGVTMTTASQVAVFDQTLGISLPEKIGAGDFVFFGKPKVNATEARSDDVRSFSQGFLLRVRTVAPTAAEEARALRCLANAKQLGLACRLFAQDHGGRFSTDVNELVPDYVIDTSLFGSPLAPTLKDFCYELLGGVDSDEPSQMLVRGLFTTSDGRRSVVYVNGWGALEWR